MRRSLVITLLVISLGLAVVGVLMVFSSSAAYAYVKYDGDSMYFLKRHVINLAVALAVGTFCAFADYHFSASVATRRRCTGGSSWGPFTSSPPNSRS
jgi:cell division protein FtsW (lipid II flippase)